MKFSGGRFCLDPDINRSKCRAWPTCAAAPPVVKRSMFFATMRSREEPQMLFLLSLRSLQGPIMQSLQQNPWVPIVHGWRSSRPLNKALSFGWGTGVASDCSFPSLSSMVLSFGGFLKSSMICSVPGTEAVGCAGNARFGVEGLMSPCHCRKFPADRLSVLRISGFGKGICTCRQEVGQGVAFLGKCITRRARVKFIWQICREALYLIRIIMRNRIDLSD